jgi:hypothetical protein
MTLTRSATERAKPIACVTLGSPRRHGWAPKYRATDPGHRPHTVAQRLLQDGRWPDAGIPAFESH